MTPERKRELVRLWRDHADELDRRAYFLRLDGDEEGARECESCAGDYRIDAGFLELSLDVEAAPAGPVLVADPLDAYPVSMVLDARGGVNDARTPDRGGDARGGDSRRPRAASTDPPLGVER